MLNYFHEQLWSPLSESLMEWDEAFHHLMLNDELRMKAYRKAIFETVQPGDRVLDLGTGTGILSQWALEAGAEHVIGIDLSLPVLSMAEARMKRAGLSARFQPIHALSYDVQLPEPVDVLISEIIGNMADNENFQPILQDAIQRFLKPNGKAIPQAVRGYLVPVAARNAHADLCAGRISSITPHYAVSQLYRDRKLSSPFNIYYDCILPRSIYLSQPQIASSYSGDWGQPSTYSQKLCFTLTERSVLTGFKSYFVAQLSDATHLDISGDDIARKTTSDSWKHAYLPIMSPIEVHAGDQLEMNWRRSMPEQSCSFSQVYRWSGVVRRQGNVIGSFDQCTSEADLHA